MARTATIERSHDQFISGTGLWTSPVAFIPEGYTLTRVRGRVRFFYDPELVTVTSEALVAGFAWGTYTDPSSFPASPLDPWLDTSASWQWHQYDYVDYTTPGGNVVVHGPRDPSEVDAKAQRGPAPVGGLWLQFAMNLDPSITDGWSASYGLAVVLLTPP